MNPLIVLMLIFFILGIVDKIIGGRLGFAAGLDRGLAQMGALAMSMAGFYCIGVTLIQNHMEAITAAASGLPFDLSMFAGLLLAPDMGGFPMSVKLAAAPEMGLFSGMLLASSIGCLLSFQLPVALTMIRAKDVSVMMRGIIPGVIAIPAGLLAGGLCLGMAPATVLFQMIPVLVLCALMSLGFWKIPQAMERVLTVFGKLVRAIGIVLFMLVMLGLFYEPLKVAEDALVFEALTVVVKITVIVCGALSLSDLLMRRARPLLAAFSRRLGVNEPSVMGLFISLTSGVAMLPLFEEMDMRGKLMNSAFTVMGAYVLGGQMAFIAGVTDGGSVGIYILAKLVGGVLAVFLAGRLCWRPKSGKLEKS